jgi:hypothetical protein
MNIDLGVESRNTAKVTAKTRAALHLQPDDHGGAAEPASNARAPLEFEDVRGQVVDDEDEPGNSEAEEAGGKRMLVMDNVLDVKWIQRLLAREHGIAKARQPGRTSDECKTMLKVADVYGSLLSEVLESFPVQARECLRFQSSARHMLDMHALRAQSIRRQCNG